MQGYAQRSNRLLLPRYQEPPPPYQPRNSQHNQQQAQFNPQPYSTEQARHCNGQQRVVNNWSAHQAVCSDGFAFQQCDGHYDAYQTLRHQPPTRHQLHHKPSNVANNAEGQAPDNPNGNIRLHGQFNTQPSLYVVSQLNYTNTETLTTHKSSSQHQAYGTCQQLQPRPDHIYPQHPQHLPGQHSGPQQTAPTSGHTLHYNPPAQNRTTMQRMINNQAQSRTAVGYTSPNSVRPPPTGPHNSPPSNNVQQSRPELKSKANPNVLSAQSPNNRSSAGHPTADANVQTCFVDQNAQNQTALNSKAQLNPTRPPFNLTYYLKSKMYDILRSQKEVQDLKNKSTTNQNQSNDGPANETDKSCRKWEFWSETDSQSAAEPPHKRMNFGQAQTYRLKKLPSKDTSGLQSALPGTHQMAEHEQNSAGNGDGGQRQKEIQYVTDPAECLEAVLAIQKSFQKVHKAVAIVPPISLFNANTEWTDDAYTKTDDSLPLKIALVLALTKESDSQDPITTEKNDMSLSEDSSPVVEQDDRMSPESKTTNSVNPTVGRDNDCDSSDAAFELSDCPEVTYTLENLRNLVKSLEMTESSAQRPENPRGVCNRILDLYWNGDVGYLKKHLKELREARSYFDVESVKDDTSVVFASITREDIKKVAHCEMVTDELCSSFEEYRSSWLNVGGQPADIGEVLSEPLSDYITVSKEASGNVFVPADNLGVNSLKDPEVTPFNVNERAKPHSESPGSIFTPSAGNGRTDTKNKEQSDAENSGVSPLCSVPSEQETFENQDDNMQNHKHVNTHPPADFSPPADTSSEQRDGNLSQDNLTIGQKESVPNIEQQVQTLLHDHLPSSDLLPACSGDKPLQSVNAVSDSVKDTEEISTTKPSIDFISTWQVEDISDDSMDGMEIPSNYAYTMKVENISEDENSDNMEIFTNTTHTFQVENISEDENSDDMEVVTKSTDICLVEDISNDENSSDDSLLMDVTVLSSEEALTFFQQLEKKFTHSSVDHPKLMASSPSQPNREYNKANICSGCGINDILTSNSTDVTDSDRELFCPACWDKAPSLDLEMDPCDESSDGESEKLEDNCGPSSEMEVLEPVIASTDVHVAEEELAENPKDDTVINSVAEQKTLEIDCPAEQEIVKIQADKMKAENSETISMPKLYRNKTDGLGDGAASEKTEDNCGMPSLEMEVLETVIASVPEQKVPEIRCNVEQELAKIRPDKTKDERMKIKSKSAILKRKFKPSSARMTSDDSVLFAPDIVLKKSQPHKKNHKAMTAVNCPGGQILKCNSAIHINKPTEERPDLPLHAATDKTWQNHKDKVREKQSSESTQFMKKTLHRSNTMPEVHTHNLSEKLTTTGKKKVRFALYGCKSEKQCAAPGRKFSPPTSLTVRDAGKHLSKNTFPKGRRFSAPATLSADYSDVISAKQKVHNQWSSTFIPTAKKTPHPKSPPKGEPLKKKPLKAHNLLKSNMSALKNQMVQRSMLLSSQDISKSVQKH